MKRVLIAAGLVALLPSMSLAFCGGWDSPVAPGFDGSSWGEKWPVLAVILTSVALFSTFVVRRVAFMRALPEEV